MAEGRGSSALGWVLVLPALLLPALALAGPVTSADLWWHLSMGRWILANGKLPVTDPFSHTADTEPAEIHEYGAQVLLALVDQAGGVPLLRVVGALLALALVTAVFLVARRRLSPTWAAASATLFAALYALKWELRPHILSSFLLLAVSEFAFPPTRSLPRRDPGARECALLFALAAVWTQLHAEAVFTQIFALAGLIGAVLGALVEGDGGWKRVRAWLLMLAAATLGTLLSPGGLKQPTYALSDSSIPRNYIDEWFPLWEFRLQPLPVALQTLVLAAALLGGAFVAGAAFARFAPLLRRMRGSQEPAPRDWLPSWERIGFLAVCVVMAVLARRFFWLLWFPLHDFLVLAVGRLDARARALPAIAALALALVLARTHFVADAADSASKGLFARTVDADLLPLFATDFVEDARLEGNLYHRYEWGGYLGYRLWPRNRVFVDGRTVMFAHVIPERWYIERWEAETGLEDTREYAEERLAARDVRVIVMPSVLDVGSGPRRWRPPSANEVWIRAFADATATVWIRGNDADNYARVSAWYAARGMDYDTERKSGPGVPR